MSRQSVETLPGQLTFLMKAATLETELNKGRQGRILQSFGAVELCCLCPFIAGTIRGYYLDYLSKPQEGQSKDPYLG